ncbi:MlaD family protein [Fodinibius halophilus]|uniref:MCE family protein n=1 Tax=Fodinibius halophilus TaxID=1736908 RepID=A0A6M1T5U7_9BACT|nr:MlaD family protein [Fodinibius halophilus]NGP88645.1 MCE family protein [Fodinibius halophilus]
MKINNELKVALTILAAIAFGFIGYRMMSDLPLFRQSKVVHSYFDRTDGLSPGNYIYINGVKVGSVKKLQLSNNDSVKVTMSFDLDVRLPKNSVAYLESSGLLNEKAIVVKRGDAKEELKYGGTMEGVYSGGMMETLKEEGEQLSEDVSESFGKLNELLEQLNKVVDKENQGKVDKVIEDVRSTSNDIATLFERKKSDLESSIGHARNFLANVDTVSMRNKSRVDSVMTGFENSLAELEALSRDLQETNSQLNQILTKINNGEGSLGKLVNDSTLYNNLESMSAEMDLLIKNINENPRKYLKHMRLIEVF